MYCLREVIPKNIIRFQRINKLLRVARVKMQAVLLLSFFIRR